MPFFSLFSFTFHTFKNYPKNETKKAPLLKGLSTFVWLELEELYISNHKNTNFSWKSQIEQHSIE